MFSLQLAFPSMAIASITWFKTSRVFVVLEDWTSFARRSDKIASADKPSTSGSCTFWKAKSIYLFFLDMRSQISSLIVIAWRCLQFSGGGYFSPFSPAMSSDKSPVKMSSTKDAILASMGEDFFVLDFKAWVRLSIISCSVVERWSWPSADFATWAPLFVSSKAFTAAVGSTTSWFGSSSSERSSCGSGNKRRSYLRFLKASVWDSEAWVSCAIEAWSPCKSPVNGVASASSRLMWPGEPSAIRSSVIL